MPWFCPGGTLRFSLEAPEDFDQVPLSVAATLYEAGTEKPMFMPAWVLADAIPPGPLAAGAVADYVVPNVNLSGVDRVDGLPRTRAFRAVVYVEGGGNPIPEPGREHLALREVRIEDASSGLVIKGPIELKPYGGMFAPVSRQECVGRPDFSVIPAKAGIQKNCLKRLDSGSSPEWRNPTKSRYSDTPLELEACRNPP